MNKFQQSIIRAVFCITSISMNTIAIGMTKTNTAPHGREVARRAAWVIPATLAGAVIFTRFAARIHPIHGRMRIREPLMAFGPAIAYATIFWPTHTKRTQHA